MERGGGRRGDGEEAVRRETGELLGRESTNVDIDGMEQWGEGCAGAWIHIIEVGLAWPAAVLVWHRLEGKTVAQPIAAAAAWLAVAGGVLAVRLAIGRWLGLRGRRVRPRPRPGEISLR